MIKKTLEKKLNPISIIVSIIISILLAVFALPPFIDWIKKQNDPEFKLSNYSFNNESIIYVYPKNYFAQKRKPITIKIDDVLISKSFECNSSDSIKWVIDFNSLTEQEKKALNNNKHTISICFDDECQNCTVDINNEFLNVYTKLTTTIDSVFIEGLGSKHVSSSLNDIKVDMVYHLKDQLIHNVLPIEYQYDTIKKTLYFTFKSNIQNLPKIPKSDPAYNQLALTVHITDQYGSAYYNTFTYADLANSGTKYFGSGNMDISYERNVFTESNQEINFSTFKLIPRKPIQPSSDGSVINIIVTAKNDKGKLIEWNNNIKHPSITKVYRDNKLLGTTFLNKYVDNDIKANNNSKYKIEKRTSDGITHSSLEMSVNEYLKLKKETDALDKSNDSLKKILNAKYIEYNARDLTYPLLNKHEFITQGVFDVIEFNCSEKDFKLNKSSFEVHFKLLQAIDTSIYTPLYIRIILKDKDISYVMYRDFFQILPFQNKIRIPLLFQKPGLYALQLGYLNRKEYETIERPTFYSVYCNLNVLSVDSGAVINIGH